MEGEKPTCIHEHLLQVYGKATVDMSTFQRSNKID